MVDFVGSLTGVQNIDKVFNNLPRSMQRKAYMQALRAGAAPVRDSASNNIRSVLQPFTGLSARRGTIRIYNLRKYKGSFRVAVQVRRGLVNTRKTDGQGKPVRVGLYLAVAEYGSTKLNRAPRSWIRKAIREQKSNAISNVTKEMNKRIVEAVEDAKNT